jgi:hypothetical protein
VTQAKADLVREGYSVFLDYDDMPEIKPDEVTKDTAEELRKAMHNCNSLVFALSANAQKSRWMPWELGYFDGFKGRVFVYPLDEDAESCARGQEYLRIYPLIPRTGRSGYLAKNLPKAEAANPLISEAVQGLLRSSRGEGLGVDDRPPLFDYAQQQASAAHGEYLRREMVQGIFDPAGMIRVMGEITQAWWRLWGVMPPPRRPGTDEDNWGR